MEKGSKVTPISGDLQKKEYLIEAIDTKMITPGDGPASIRNWLRIKLKGIQELQWAKDFQVIS